MVVSFIFLLIGGSTSKTNIRHSTVVSFICFLFIDGSTGCLFSDTDLVFSLDSSTSVTAENLQMMRDFLKDFLSNADIDSGSVRVGVNVYSTRVETVFYLNNYTQKNQLTDAIDRIPHIYGSTNIADALKVTREDMFTQDRGDRTDKPNVCVLLTDGVSNINPRRTIPEAEQTRNNGIHIYVIAIGLRDRREAEGVASPPSSKNLFNLQTFNQLEGVKQQLLKAICENNKNEPINLENAEYKSIRPETSD